MNENLHFYKFLIFYNLLELALNFLQVLWIFDTFEYILCFYNLLQLL